MINLVGQSVLTYITNIFTKILKTKQIFESLHEAKKVILFEEGDPKDIKNYRPVTIVTQLQNIHDNRAN